MFTFLYRSIPLALFELIKERSHVGVGPVCLDTIPMNPNQWFSEGTAITINLHKRIARLVLKEKSMNLHGPL